MELVTRLGNPTWSCDGSGLSFVGNEFLAATDFSGLFHIFDLNTGTAVSTWRKHNEQLNCVSFDGEETFFVGGSFGSVYTLTWRKGRTVELREEREVLSYFDLIEFCGKHSLIAAVCDDELKLLPRWGVSGIIGLTFPDTIKSVQWSDRLDAFLVVCRGTLYSVSPAGTRSVILQRESRLLAAQFHEGTDSFTLLVGTSDNDAELLRLSRTTLAVSWSAPLILDHFEFAKTGEPREWDIASLQVVAMTGEVVVTGVNWVAKYDPNGALAGSQIRLTQMVQTLSVSSDGNLIAVSASMVGLQLWSRDLRPIWARDCHYSSVTNLIFVESDALVVSSCDFSPEVLCWDLTNRQRKWARSFGGYWCDGLLSSGPATNDLVVASSNTDSTQIVSVSPQTAEVIAQQKVNCEFRAQVKRTSLGQLTLAPASEYGPLGIAAVAEFSSLKGTTVFAGEDRLSTVVATEHSIIAADKSHIWVWDRDDTSRARDLDIVEEGLSGSSPVISIVMLGDESFVAVTKKGALKFSTPRFESRLVAKFTSTATSVSLPQEGRVVIGFEDGHAELRTVPQFELVHSWVAHQDSGVTSSTFAREKTLIATGARDGTIAVWDFSSQR